MSAAEDQPQARPTHFEFGWISVAATKKLGTVPEGFRFFRCWASQFGIGVAGAIMKTATKGKMKGKLAPHGEQVSVLVLDADVDAERARYEIETGKCSECLGSGEEFRRWSKDKGTETKTCSKCNGTGNATQATEAAQ